MNAAVALGALLGLGVIVVLSGLIPARVPLAVALAQPHRHRRPNGLREADSKSLWTRLIGVPIALSSAGATINARFGTDLRVAESDPATLAAKAALAGLVGVLWAPAVAGLMVIGGVGVSWGFPAWASLALGIGGALLPVVALRAEAAHRRRAFRHALGCYLDLVAVRLAGGAGVDSALNHSARTGSGWAFTELRLALDEARLMGEPPWSGLERLGEQLAIPELCELAAATSLAGGEGARVRSSLAAKARSIRTKGLADAEAAAQSASERMSLPVVLLMLGFVAFLGYPAVMQVFTGL